MNVITKFKFIVVTVAASTNSPLFPALRTGSTAVSGAFRRKKNPSCKFKAIAPLLSTIAIFQLLTCCAGYVGYEERGRNGRPDITFISPDNRFESAIIAGDFKKAMPYATPDRLNQRVNGEYPVHRAAARGHHREALAFIDKGADSRVVNSQGQSLAYVAALSGSRSIAETYVAKGGGSSSQVVQGDRLYQLEVKERQQRRDEWAAKYRSESKASSRQESNQGNLVKCPRCEGGGKLWVDRYTSWSYITTCKTCGGSGAVTKADAQHDYYKRLLGW